MKTIREEIRDLVKKESFEPTWLGVVVNPVFIVRNGLFKAIKKLAPEIKGNVLDFGCGSKPYENLFIHAESYIGCDIEVSGHDHQDSKIDHFFDGKQLPFADETFDAVVSFEVFEHVFDLPAILKEIYRVTRPDGSLLISVPFVWAEHEAPYDFARYTSFGISHLLKNAGFQVIELEKTSSSLLASFQIVIAEFYQCLAPKNRYAKFFQLLFIFPLMFLAHVIDSIVPKQYDFFCGTVILAKKGDASEEKSHE